MLLESYEDHLSVVLPVLWRPQYNFLSKFECFELTSVYGSFLNLGDWLTAFWIFSFDALIELIIILYCRWFISYANQTFTLTFSWRDLLIMSWKWWWFQCSTNGLRVEMLISDGCGLVNGKPASIDIAFKSTEVLEVVKITI